jgi:hypothetical protein
LPTDLFIYRYVLTLIAAGAFGILFSRLDVSDLIGLDLTQLSLSTTAPTMSTYRSTTRHQARCHFSWPSS